MKAEQVDAALRQKFVIDGERLVFWHDPHAEFATYLVYTTGDAPAPGEDWLLDIRPYSAQCHADEAERSHDRAPRTTNFRIARAMA